AIRIVFGKNVEIFIPKKQQQQSASVASIQSCHLGFHSPQEAQHAVVTFQGKTVQWEHPNLLPPLRSGPLFLDYATITNKSKNKQARDAGIEVESGQASRSECTSTTDHVNIPGLLVIPEYMNQAQEQVLMAVLTGPQAPWALQQRNKSQTGAVKRKVQHYGYVFDYPTANVLRDRTGDTEQNPANCPPLPKVECDNVGNDEVMDELIKQGKGWDVLAHVIEKTRRY
ncbi:MAG: hypothetical protein SGILL_008032, partial [Bacillariaceae sp.]